MSFTSRFLVVGGLFFATYFTQAQEQAAGSISGRISVEQIAQFPGGPEALAAYLAAVPYPEAARASKVEGRIFVQFEISPQGKAENVEAIQPPVSSNRRKAASGGGSISYPLLVEAAQQAIAAMPTWTPATQNGNAVVSTQTVPVDFNLTPTNPAPIYAYADQMPAFLGVTAQIPLQGSIQRAIRYPADALRNRQQGQVLAYFVVDEQGQIGQVEIIRPVYPAIDEEVVRAIRAQKAVTPAAHQGKPVKVFYVVPLNFAIRWRALASVRTRTAAPEMKRPFCFRGALRLSFQSLKKAPHEVQHRPARGVGPLE